MNLCGNGRERTVRQFVIVRFSCVCPVTDNELRHNIVKEVMRIHSAQYRNFDNVIMTNSRREEWKTDVNLLINQIYWKEEVISKMTPFSLPRTLAPELGRSFAFSCLPFSFSHLAYIMGWNKSVVVVVVFSFKFWARVTLACSMF